MMNNYQIELELYAKGRKYIAGTDEVGRGPLAGPVVATAVIMPKDCYIEGVTDSKKLSAKKRKVLKKEIEEKALSIVTVFIDESTIDQINIYEASKLAMIKAVAGLKPRPDIVLSDAMKLPLDMENIPLIKGDEKSFVIGCASIIAKETRDAYMMHLDQKYPGYGFATHKGYPTKTHLLAIEAKGILPIHRRSYKPIANKLKKENIKNK